LIAGNLVALVALWLYPVGILDDHVPQATVPHSGQTATKFPDLMNRHLRIG
jgi:hypothetical protein